MGGLVGGWVDGWVAIWSVDERWMDGRMNGWMDECVNA